MEVAFDLQQDCIRSLHKSLFSIVHDTRLLEKNVCFRSILSNETQYKAIVLQATEYNLVQVRNLWMHV